VLAFAVGCSKHRSDETIAQDVQSKVATDPVVKNSAVVVTAKEGKLTLKGTVKDTTARQRVEEIAGHEAGATGVNDETAVTPVPVPAPEEATSTTVL
jgi:osmotically-inducible protein OsmY